MSVIFVVTPLIIGGWPVLAACASAAAAHLGYRQLKGGVAEKTEEVETSVALDAGSLGEIGAGMRGDESMAFGNESLRLTVRKDARGKVTVHVDGRGRSAEELKAVGEGFLQKVLQQYAYQKVAKELKQKGYQIVDEGVEAKGSIRIRFRTLE